MMPREQRNDADHQQDFTLLNDTAKLGSVRAEYFSATAVTGTNFTQTIMNNN